MRLTQHTDYALRLLLLIGAHQDRLVTVPEAARVFVVSRHHLTKVARTLTQTGYVEALRGRHGGLRLGRDARSIRVGDVVRATEPDFHLVECFGPRHAACGLALGCGLAAAIDRASRAFLAELDAVTLADLLGDPGLHGRLVTLMRAA